MCELEERQLVSTENTTVNLLCTIRPIQLAFDQLYEQQLAQMDTAAERQRAAEALTLCIHVLHVCLWLIMWSGNRAHCYMFVGIPNSIIFYS